MNKKIIIISGVAVLILVGLLFWTDAFTTKSADAAWYSSGGTWTNRKTIVPDPQKVGSTTTSYLTNFPMLISVTDPDLKYTSFGGQVASSTGGDILFTAGDGTTALNYEIESYASTTGTLIAWVKIPFLSSTTTSPVYMYYGNASAPNVSAATATGVWDSNYKGVWHLPNGTSLTANDSTSNGYNGTLVATPTATTGQVDGAAQFVKASSQYITNANASVTTYPITLQAWVKLADTSFSDGDDRVAVSVAKKSGIDEFWFGYYRELGINYLRSVVQSDSGANFRYLKITKTLDTNWHHIVAIFTNSSTHSIYVDGALQSGSYNTGGNGIPIPSGISDTYIGGFLYSTSNFYGGMGGNEDEVRISNIGRSDDWILTEYRNQSSPSSFYAYGLNEQTNRTVAGQKVSSSAAVAGAPGWYSGSWLYRKKISIDPAKVGSTTTSYLNDFPILVSVIDNDLKYTSSGGKVASSTAGDIIFTAGNGTTALNYEIEKYVSTTGELVAWVKVPFVSSTSTTPIYMYVGNASAPNVSAATATGVWDSNYKGVWHLPDVTSGAGTVLDSTGVNNGTPQASPTNTTGKIDGAGNFVRASNQYISVANSSSLQITGDVTLEAWVNLSADLGAGESGRIFSKLGNSPYNGYEFYLDASGPNINEITFQLGKNIPSTQYIITNTLVSANSWTHIVATLSSGTMAIYVNSTAVSSFRATSGQGSASISADTTVGNIGRWPGGGTEWFPGKIDELRISSNARSSDWILTEYRNQSSPSSFYGYGGLENYNGRVNSSSSFATAALVAHTSCGTNNCTTSGIDTRGASLIVLSVPAATACQTPTDSQSLTWNTVATFSAANGMFTCVYYAYNFTGVASHTFTTGTNGYGLIMAAFSGTLTTSDPLDVKGGGAGNCGPGTSCGTTANSQGVLPFTPSQNNELVIAVMNGGTTDGTKSINAGTITDQLSYSNGNSWGNALAYNVQTTAASWGPTWTWQTSLTYYNFIGVSFKQGTVGAGPGVAVKIKGGVKFR